MISNIFKQILRHKFITGIILPLVIAGGYFGYQRLAGDKNTVRYVTAAVEKGTLIVSVSGSGQVSASDQVDIKSKVKGEVVAVYVENGEEVKTGKLIVELDDTDFQKAVEEAETSLETAKLELKELLSPPDELTLSNSENAVLQAKNSLEKLKLDQATEYQKALETKQEAENNIEMAYEDALNTITNAFWDLPTIITGTGDILYSYKIVEDEWGFTSKNSNYQQNEIVYREAFSEDEYRDKIDAFLNSAKNDYKRARENYDPNFENYSNTSFYSEKEVVEDLLNETIETTKSIAQAIKSEVNLLAFIVDYFSNHNRRVYGKITDYQSDLKSYTSKTSSYLSSLLSVQRSLRDNKEAKLSAERSLAEMEKTHPLDLVAAEISPKEKEKSLAEIIAGPDELEIRAKQSAIQQKEDALLAAKQDLADCYIYIPFDGIITEVKTKKGDSVSAGTVLANIITQQKIAKISLNEVDAAKVKVGQKVTLTFDALPEVSISGKVIEVDTVGTVAQGVVSYGVKINFDTEAEAVKPGMSVTADIITDAEQDVLVLPNSAVKSQGNSYYVELVEAPEEMRQQLLANTSGVTLPNPPKSQSIEIGLSNDLSTEIVSGLKEGDIVVTSTISPNAVQTTQTKNTQTQGFQIPGMGGQGVIQRISR